MKKSKTKILECKTPRRISGKEKGVLLRKSGFDFNGIEDITITKEKDFETYRQKEVIKEK